MLMAVFRAVRRVGPSALTLAEVAREAGVSAAAVVQRFGSKRNLLLAAAADIAANGGLFFEGLRARHHSPLAALLGIAACMAMLQGETPRELAHSLSFAHLDLTDADFHRQALRASKTVTAGIRRLVRDAVRAGELMSCDTGRLASALHATLNGSLLNWAVRREGSLIRWVERDLRTVLGPYRAARGRKPGVRAYAA